MKILVVGSGGREHTLIWKIIQSKKVSKVYCAPGNGGIAEIAECVEIDSGEINSLADFALGKKIDLTVVGPEIPLARGIVDLFEEKGLRIFGPRKNAAILETSKVFSKEMMFKYGLPTARGRIFDNLRDGQEYIDDMGAPIVVKADGLTAGKGVIVCAEVREAKKAIVKIMEEKVFGEAGERVIIEELLKGDEASILVFTDGEHIVPLVSSQDYKQIFDGDKGPNTGGMGAYSPAPLINEDLKNRIIEEIIRPIIKGMNDEGRRYKGVLYAGIMVTDEGPKVLEFNARFGDPETQVILPRLKDDLVSIMEEIVDGELTERELTWDKRFCACVVLASGGYPGKYEKDKEISGLRETKETKNTFIFHAGTKRMPSGGYATNGGRVLGVTALGNDINDALSRAYEVAGKLHFDNIYYRKDIGHRAIGRHKSETLHPF